MTGHKTTAQRQLRFFNPASFLKTGQRMVGGSLWGQAFTAGMSRAPQRGEKILTDGG